MVKSKTISFRAKALKILERLPLRHRRNWCHLLALIFLISILIWTFAKIDQPAYTQPDGGSNLSFTPFNDYLILMGGKHFHEEGFAENYFLANMTVGYPEFARGWYAYQTPLTDVPNARIYYTHYGSYDAIMMGLLLKMGITELPDLYKVMTIFSIIALALWYGVATRLFGHVVALISLLTMGTSLVFLRFIDNVSVYTYDVLLAFGAALLFVWVEQRQDITNLRRKAAYAGVLILAFFLMGNSPEFVPWLTVFFIGYLWAGRGKQVWKRWKTVVLLVAAPVLAQLIHFLQVSVALGGMRNTLIDFTAALTRRTAGFGIAEETGYREYTLGRALLKIEGDLWSTLCIEFIGLVALLALSWWLTDRLSRNCSTEAREQLWYRFKLLLIFFVAGISMWLLMIQSTVTQAGSVYRTILPFVGLALGYCSINIFRYLRLHQEPLAFRIIIFAVLLTIVVPTFQDRFSGRPFQFEQHQQRMDMYYGIYPEEIRMFGSFLREKTAYGDIIITDFRIAETGHPRYPFPGYEYHSDRRIEVARDVSQATIALGELNQVRASLPATNPASRVQFYLLVDEGSIEEDFGKFSRQVADLQDTLYETDYWMKLYGTVPFPAGSSITFPPRVFSLFKVDIGKFNEYQLTSEKTDS